MVLLILLTTMVAATSLLSSYSSLPVSPKNVTNTTAKATTGEKVLSITSGTTDSRHWSTVRMISEPLPGWASKQSSRTSKQSEDQLCCAISLSDAVMPAAFSDRKTLESLQKCSSQLESHLMQVTLKVNAVPQIWSRGQGSSHLLTCLNGNLDLDRRKEEQEEEEESGRKEGLGRNGTSARQSVANNGTEGRQRSEQQLVIPHIVHPINCVNKTLTDDQTNGSAITDPSDRHVDDDGAAGDEQRTSNISLTFEYQPVMAVSGRTLITIRAPHQRLKLRCKVFASPEPVIRWKRLFDLQNKDPAFLPHSSTDAITTNATSSDLWFRTRTEHHACWSQSTLELVIEQRQDLGTYVCSASNGHGSAATSFSIRANSLKIFSAREFNVTAFVSGMIPPVVVCILFIMKLGYRSRYASTAVEEEALEEERMAYETNNINLFT